MEESDDQEPVHCLGPRSSTTESQELLNLPCPDTALSSGVKRLITVVGVQDVPQNIDERQYITENGIINWEAIGAYMSNIPPSSPEYYTECVKVLAPCFSLAEQLISTVTEEEFLKQYDHLFDWTKFKQVFLDMFRTLKMTDETGTNLCLLVITACLENSLGDVFLLKGTQCPSLLKDLLVSPELEHIFSSKVMQVLQVVIGPPASLNLRNVVWHGFPSCGEIPKRYACFLLLVISSLGQILIQQNNLDIPHRPSCNLDEFCTYAHTFPDIDINDLITVILASSFIAPNTQQLWKAAIEHFQNGRYCFSAVLLFPLLEHGFRRVFSLVNNCPNRVLTAEVTTLYTTFDEILCYVLPDGSCNKISKELGEPYMDILFDILVYSDGPRCRDRLSHGEMDLYKYPESFVNLLLVLSLVVAAKYIPKTHDGLIQTSTLCNLIEFCSNYQSVFHPVSLVKQKVKSVSEIAAELPVKITCTSDLNPRLSYSIDEILGTDEMEEFKQLQHGAYCVVGICQLLWNNQHVPLDELQSGLLGELCDGRSSISALLKTKLSTLYRFQPSVCNGKLDGAKQCMIVGILLKIMDECKTMLSQTIQTLCQRQDQLAAKTLRSRQRDNLQRLIKSCPFIHLFSHMMMYLVIWHLYHLDSTVDQHDDQAFKNDIKYLKTLLQFMENLRTYTSPDKNKWSEAKELVFKCMSKVKVYWGVK